MGEMVVVNQEIIEVLREVRKNALQKWQKQQRLDDIPVRITSAEAAIKGLNKGYKSLKSEHERQERQDEIDKIADELDELYALKKRLPEELNTHKGDLLYYRERLEDRLWHALVESGQIRADEDASDIAPDELQGEEGQGSAAAENSCSAGEGTNPEECRTRKAQFILGSAKAKLEDAKERFHYLDRLCEAQQYEFENHVHPEWHDMSRTEFDVDQLALKIDHTRELIRAQKAYSEAARYAIEVGLVREDSDQSCHFLDEADDGNCSGDQYAFSVEKEDTGFIENWRKTIAPACPSPSTRSEGDVWEVDSVSFGEGTSAHADEWEKIRIDRWDEMREVERKRMHEAGTVACADELLCRHTRSFDCHRPASELPIPVGQPATGQAPRAGLWKPSFIAVRDLVISGHAIVARFSASWYARRASAA